MLWVSFKMQNEMANNNNIGNKHNFINDVLSNNRYFNKFRIIQ